MNFVVIADLNGPENFHVGDEAMFEANLVRMRELFPGGNFTVLSQNPPFTSNHYNVKALPYFGFSPVASEANRRKTLLQEVLEKAAKAGKGLLNRSGPWREIFDSLKDCNALIISGGGNINSTWPHHLYERAALCKIAALYGKPVIFTGQTIGPNLTVEDRALLKEILPLARLVGVREKASLEMCRELGLPPAKTLYQLDDAAFLKSTPPPPGCTSLPDKLMATGKPWLAITIHHFTDFDSALGQKKLKAIATQLRKICRETGTQPIFISHVAFAPGLATLPDEAVGQKLARLLEPEIEMPVLGVRPAGEVHWLTGQAAMVISTRYHPLVFALAEGVPALGLCADNYTEIKLKGALEHAGLADWLIPLELAATRVFPALALELWQKRREVTRHLQAVRANWLKDYQTRWGEIEAAITGVPENSASFTWEGNSGEEAKLLPATFKGEFEGHNSAVIRPSTFLTVLIADLKEWDNANSAHFAEVKAEKDCYIASLLEEITALRRMQAEKDRYNIDLKEALAVKDTYIGILQELLTEKDNYIQILAENLTRQAEHLKTLETNLAQKEVYIKSLEKSLARKDNYIKKGSLEAAVEKEGPIRKFFK